MNYCCIFGFML